MYINNLEIDFHGRLSDLWSSLKAPRFDSKSTYVPQLVGIAVMASDLPIHRLECDVQDGHGLVAIGACILAR